MNKIEKTVAETNLDKVVDDLTAEDYVVVYALGRYDDISGEGQVARFSSRISYNDGLDPDPVVEKVLLRNGSWDLGTGNLDLSFAVELLRNEGWDVFIGYGRPYHDGVVAGFFTDCEEPGDEHRRLDLTREVMVEWSNARHTGKLVWQE